jgi:hypothetical protein
LTSTDHAERLLLAVVFAHHVRHYKVVHV